MLSAGIAAGAFWTLYGFVNDTLEKTTPEGILTEIQKTLTPTFVVNSAHAAKDNPAERDPFLPLISVISSVISEKDRVSASRGLDILGDRIVDLLQTTPKEVFEEEAPVDQSLEVVCTNQLPEIVQEAVDEELTQIAVDVTETAETVGDVAVEEEVERVLYHVLEGQTDLINSLGYESNEERIRSEGLC